MTKKPTGMSEAPREYKLEDNASDRNSKSKRSAIRSALSCSKELLPGSISSVGDNSMPRELPEAVFSLSPFDPELERTMEIARQGHARVPRYACRAGKMT